MGVRRVGVRRVGVRRVGPEGRGTQNFALFFLVPPQISFFSSLSGGLLGWALSRAVVIRLKPIRLAPIRLPLEQFDLGQLAQNVDFVCVFSAVCVCCVCVCCVCVCCVCVCLCRWRDINNETGQKKRNGTKKKQKNTCLFHSLPSSFMLPLRWPCCPCCYHFLFRACPLS